MKNQKMKPIAAPLDLRLELAAEQRPVDHQSVRARLATVANMTLKEYFYQSVYELERIEEMMKVTSSDTVQRLAARIVRLSEFDQKKGDEATWLFVAPINRLHAKVTWKRGRNE